MPTQSASLYEQLFALTTVMKQRVVDNFSGDALNERWDVFIQTSTFTAPMADSVNGGVELTTGTGTNHGGGIDYNGINQFAHDGSVFICVCARDNSTNIHQSPTGLRNGTTADNAGSNSATWSSSTVSGQANFFMRTINNSGTQTDTASSIARDTSIHGFKLELGASDVVGYIDGVSEATSTTNLPTTKLEPLMGLQNGSSASAVKMNVSYCEVYNT